MVLYYIILSGSGGSTGLPATPAPTPFSLGPGGVRPEDLAASISRLSVIQETQADTSPAINILEASPASAAPDPATSPRPSNPNNLSNYFGTPQNSGSSAADSIFDQLSASPRSRATSESTAAAQSGFTDITINTPVKRAPAMAGPAPAPVSPAPAESAPAAVPVPVEGGRHRRVRACAPAAAACL